MGCGPQPPTDARMVLHTRCSAEVQLHCTIVLQRPRSLLFVAVPTTIRIPGPMGIIAPTTKLQTVSWTSRPRCVSIRHMLRWTVSAEPARPGLSVDVDRRRVSAVCLVDMTMTGPLQVIVKTARSASWLGMTARLVRLTTRAWLVRMAVLLRLTASVPVLVSGPAHASLAITVLDGASIRTESQWRVSQTMQRVSKLGLAQVTIG